MNDTENYIWLFVYWAIENNVAKMIRQSRHIYMKHMGSQMLSRAITRYLKFFEKKTRNKQTIPSPPKKNLDVGLVIMNHRMASMITRSVAFWFFLRFIFQKEFVYEIFFSSPEDLALRITAAARCVWDTPDIFEKVHYSMQCQCHEHASSENFEYTVKLV